MPQHLPHLSPSSSSPTDGSRALPSAIVRRATAADAVSIARLYCYCYASTDGREPTQNYPYPQVLDVHWLTGVLKEHRVEAMVAEQEDHICGVVAAALESPESSGVAEFFGLAVDPQSRGQSLATQLLQAACKWIGQSVQVAIGEVRLADPAASHVVQKTVLQPVGFEPFVHVMLAGAESMIAVCALSEKARTSRVNGGTTTRLSHRLANIVLRSFKLRPPPVRRMAVHVNAIVNAELIRLGVEEDASLQATVRSQWIGRGIFLTLHRMEILARRDSAFEQGWYGLKRLGVVVAQARVIQDHRDHRVRILDLEAASLTFATMILRHISEILERKARRRMLVIVAEVSTEEVSMQVALEAAGFRPTAYFPAIVNREGRYYDAVQYNRLSGISLEECKESLVGLKWQPALRLAKHVLTSIKL